MLRAFLKDSVTYTLPAFISRGLSLFLVPLYTRVLSPEAYGSLDLLTVFAGIINLTVALEISQGLARYYSDVNSFENKTLYSSSALWFTIFCYSVFSVLAIFFTKDVSNFVMGQSGMETSFQLGVIFIWCNGFFYLVQNQFRWELRSKEYAIANLLMSYTTAIASVFFAYFLRLGLEGMLYGMIIGNIAGVIFALSRLQESFRFQFDVHCLQEMLAFSVPLVFSGVAIWVSLYIDRIMISQMLSVKDVGLYGMGFRVASIAGLVMIGFQSALTPLVYSHHHKADTPTQLAKIFRFFMLFALFAFLILALFAQDIIKLLATEEFSGGSVVIAYLAPALLLNNMYIFTPGISICKKTHFMIWINISVAFLNIILNFTLIPTFGIIGAAISTLTSSFSGFIIHIALSQKLYYIPHRLKPITAIAIITALLVTISQNINENLYTQHIINIALIGIYFILCFIFGLIQKNELLKAYELIVKKTILRKL